MSLREILRRGLGLRLRACIKGPLQSRLRSGGRDVPSGPWGDGAVTEHPDTELLVHPGLSPLLLFVV